MQTIKTFKEILILNNKLTTINPKGREKGPPFVFGIPNTSYPSIIHKFKLRFLNNDDVCLVRLQIFFYSFLLLGSPQASDILGNDPH